MAAKRRHQVFFILMLIPVLSFSLVATCAAEVTPSIKHLMQEPVTMLDWGMYKLALYLNQELKDRYVNKISKFAPRITVYYKADSAKIQISAAMLYKKFPNKDEAKMYCEGIITYIRGLLVFKQPKGTLPVPQIAPRTTLGSYFGQHGEHHKNVPKNLEEELSKSTELIVVTMDKFDQPVICKAPLLGSEIEFLYGLDEQDNQTTKKENPE